jgi:hypothetical protein
MLLYDGVSNDKASIIIIITVIIIHEVDKLWKKWIILLIFILKNSVFYTYSGR